LLLSAFILIFSSLAVVFINQDDVHACGRSNDGRGYFYCEEIWQSSFNVLVNGLPSHVNTKAEFISHIEGLVLQGDYTSANSTSYNKIGAAFIIQTMRGGTDHDHPSAADIADWKARINNPNITLKEEDRVADINSARSAFRNGVRDIYRATGDSNSYPSLVFYEGDATKYIVKYWCGNPMGNLPGLPNLNYNLTPTMTASPDSGEGGSTATLSPTVSNANSTNTTATSPSVGWRITSFSVLPGATIPDGSTNSTETPVTHYGNGATVIQSGSRTFDRGVSSISADPHTMPDAAVGTRICYALSVTPYSHTTGDRWRHSTPDCVTIAKKPKVQVLGSDLIVGKGQTSNVATSSTTKSISGTNRTFGSWGEYGIAASGRVTSMASGAGYSGGATRNVFCRVSLLTFSNVNTGQTTCTSASLMGGYSNTSALPDIASRLSSTGALNATLPLDLATISTGSYTAGGNIRISSSGRIASGKWIVINAPTSTVTITGNINYTTDVLQSLEDIPQVVIIANQIRIVGSVTNVDAWLIASGTTGNLITCSDVASASELNATRCNRRLTVNGPVVARHLYLYRTAGAGTGTQTGNPAEVFNLRPDAYLWATGYLSDDGRLQTVTTKELPPRF
jgi:hypothetical protein